MNKMATTENNGDDAFSYTSKRSHLYMAYGNEAKVQSRTIHSISRLGTRIASSK